MGLSRRPRGPLPWRRALETLALTVCLSVWTQSAAAEVTNATVGQTVKLTSPVTADISSFNWYKGTVVVDPQLICTCFVSPPKQLNGPQYTGRETGHPDGSLVIRDLLRNYTGNYTVFVTPNGARPVTATRELRVYENVSIPVIHAVTQNPVENGSLVLVCNASGTDVSYQWYQDGKLIASGGRINMTSNSQTLTLSPCTRNDTGTSFTCGASNAVSHSTSSQYTLTVSYGPDTPVISVSPEKPFYLTGETVTLSCTAASYPPVLYTWLLNGQSLLSTGPELVINSLTLTDSGNYTCNTSNSVTHLSKHAIWGIRILEPVTKPTVTWVPSQLVENQGPAEINCDTSKAATTILWSFNNSPDLPGNILLSLNNRTLYIANVSWGDSGTYQCVAKNPVSSRASDPRTLHVAFGPEHLRIDPPERHSVQVGTKLLLSCTAKSYPELRYKWIINGSELKSIAGTYINEKVSSQDSGIYTCVAENKVTGLSAEASVSITVNVCLCVQSGSAQGAAAAVINARVGEAATIPAPVTADILSFTWYKETLLTKSQIICTYFASSPSQLNGPQYTGREICRPDGSLMIKDLLRNYTGYYTVNVSPNSAFPETDTIQLRVYEPVTKPTVTSEPSQLVENWGPAVITCNDSTAATTILWSFNKSPDLPANILPSSNNRTLSIANVSRGDSGTYQCEARNPVSSNASDPRTLTVAYGPEDVRIDPPGPLSVQNGTRLSLSCTAGSFPAPWYQWSLNGTDLKRPGQTYTVAIVSSQDKGNYTCVAENTITGLTVNTSVYVTVNDHVIIPTVKYVSSPLVENWGQVDITCNTTGAAITILWYFNSTSDLPVNIIQSPDNRTLTITNVSRADSGTYQCVAITPVSSSVSDPQTLTVAYGPEDMKIDPLGSQLLHVGDKLFLSCTARSIPVPRYQWLLNGTELKSTAGTFTLQVSSQDNGNYTCVAENTVTGLSAKASVSITVTGTDPSSGGSPGLSVVAIVGIVIATLMMFFIECVLIYIFVIKKAVSGPPAQENTSDAATTAEDIQYSSANVMPKGSTPLSLISAENTLYSVVRR